LLELRWYNCSESKTDKLGEDVFMSAGSGSTISTQGSLTSVNSSTQDNPFNAFKFMKEEQTVEPVLLSLVSEMMTLLKFYCKVYKCRILKNKTPEAIITEYNKCVLFGR
jgi:hypothetical protein